MKLSSSGSRENIEPTPSSSSSIEINYELEADNWLQEYIKLGDELNKMEKKYKKDKIELGKAKFSALNKHEHFKRLIRKAENE